MSTLVSIFTPTHDPKYLDDCYLSLLDQTHDTWEWVVLANGPVDTLALENEYGGDSRVVIRATGDGETAIGVGAAKRYAVELCSGEILLELDHDDVLASTALEQVVAAFAEHPDAGMVYSHTAQVLSDLSMDPSTFDLRHGWEYRDTKVDGRPVRAVVAMPPTPHNLSYIWYAPNHLRAFTRAAYDAVGGYNPDLEVLDDQDLMARLYMYGPFHLIDECLYLQRVHPENTQVTRNADIQARTVELHDATIEQLALAWAEREGLLALDLGGAHGDADPRYLRVDQHASPGVDIVHTFPHRLESGPARGLAMRGDGGPVRHIISESSVGVIRAADFLEHVADKTAMWNELHRLLAPGGILLTHTPSTDGRGAFQDPTHVAFYNNNSFWYVTQAQYAAYVPESTARFQLARIFNGYPSPFHELHDIVYVTAHLICLKGDDQPRNGGIVDW